MYYIWLCIFFLGQNAVYLNTLLDIINAKYDTFTVYPSKITIVFLIKKKPFPSWLYIFLRMFAF